MKGKLKLWTGIGVYALVNLGTSASATAEVASVERSDSLDATTPVLVSQNNTCVAVPVTDGGEGGESSDASESSLVSEGSEGGEGGEGGEGSENTTVGRLYLPDSQRFRDRQIITDFVDQLIIPNYQLLAQRTGELEAAIATFVGNPNETTLEAARQAWLNARQPWEQSEAFAFGPAASLGLDADLDDWPLNEVDVLAVLNSQDTLTADYIDGLQTSQKGFHAIGFLLFGTDSNKPLEAFTPRELEYLSAIASVFNQTANELLDSWTQGVAGYPPFRDEFVNAGNGSALYPTVQAGGEEIVQGIIGILDELGNVKIGEAVDTQNPFLLESRFAQHSLQDFQDNLLSAQNAYLGDFPSGNTDGRGLADYVAAVNPALDAQIRQQLQASLTSLAAIPGPIEETLCDRSAQPEITAARDNILKLMEVFQEQVLPLVQQ